LLLHGVEHGRINDGQDRKRQPLVGGNVMDRGGFLRLQAAAALSTQARSQRFDGRFAKRGFALVGWIFADPPNGCAIPDGLACSGLLMGGIQATDYLPNGAAVSPDPLKDLPDHTSFFCTHLKACLTCSVPWAEIAGPIGRTRKHAHPSHLGRVSFPSSASLQDFRSLVLRDHALDLEQELIFRRLSYYSVQANHFDSGTEKLFKQEHLMSVMTCQPIRAMDVEMINAACRSHVSEAFKGRANKGGSPVAIVDKR
jgi:hypothetical protein